MVKSHTKHFPFIKGCTKYFPFIISCRLLPKLLAGNDIISRPLMDLLKKHTRYMWTSESEASFHALKKALVEAQVLALSKFSKTPVLETNAIDKGIGAMISVGHRDHAARASQRMRRSVWQFSWLSTIGARVSDGRVPDLHQPEKPHSFTWMNSASRRRGSAEPSPSSSAFITRMFMSN